MTAVERTHNPLCPGAAGGRCTGCYVAKPKPVPPAVHVACPVCHQEYVALGYTDEARDRAAAAGPTCCTNPPAAAVQPSTAAGAIFEPLTLARRLLLAAWIAVPVVLVGLFAAGWVR